MKSKFQFFKDSRTRAEISGTVGEVLQEGTQSFSYHLLGWLEIGYQDLPPQLWLVEVVLTGFYYYSCVKLF